MREYEATFPDKPWPSGQADWATTQCDDCIIANVTQTEMKTEGGNMIVRMWHGRVPTSKAEAYRAFTNERAIPDYQSVEGNISVHILERKEGDVTHFITMTFWENLEAIKGFAGDDVEVAKYYPEDKDFLLEFEPGLITVVDNL